MRVSMRPRALGIDTLITDHHLAPPTLPNATALVNPNAPGNSFPSKALAGVGVAFYLMAALTREMQTRGLHAGDAPVADLLDLVRSARSRISCRSIATIACSCIKVCDGSVRVAAAPVCSRCWKRRIANPRRARSLRISVIRSGRG
jgi:hypothetical protein